MSQWNYLQLIVIGIFLVLICCKDLMVCFRLVPEFFMCLIFLGAVDPFAYSVFFLMKAMDFVLSDNLPIPNACICFREGVMIIY